MYYTWFKDLFRYSVVGMEELMGKTRGIPVGPLSDKKAETSDRLFVGICQVRRCYLKFILEDTVLRSAEAPLN